MKQKLISDNINLVYHVIHKQFPRLIGDEDIVQCGMLGLCKAADKFDDNISKFSTFACTCISNEIKLELRNRKKHTGVVSLNYEVENDEDTVELIDIIVGETDENIENITNWSAFVDTLTERECELIELRKDGLDGVQISEKIGYSPSYICRLLRKIKLKWRNYNGD